jgi:hypothetical protein
MQELRLVAVSEDGTYAVLAVPGRGGRFSLPIDDRLRTVARGQFSRLAQYEIEVENPLRPKEIQDRIRAGETADEIADAAGIPVERVRRFEGPVLAEREYKAQEAQRSTVRGHTESGPGPRLGEIVLERLAEAGAGTEALEWDSRKRSDGNWQVQLRFPLDGQTQAAEWVFDPRGRQVMPADELARRLCLPQADWPGGRLGLGAPSPSATVTPIGSRLATHHGEAPEALQPREPRAEPDRVAARGAHAAPAGLPAPAPRPAGPETPRQAEPPRSHEQAPARPERSAPAAYAERPAPGTHRERPVPTAPAPDTLEIPVPAARPPEPAEPPAPESEAAEAHAPGTEQAQPEARPSRSSRKAARGRRASVPSWDEIMLGTSRQPD